MPYTIVSSDNTVVVTYNVGGVTIKMPATPNSGDHYFVKDSVGNASTNNITIDGNGKLIDGTSTFLLNQNYSAVYLAYNGVSWNIF